MACKCGGSSLKEVIFEPDSTHYGKYVCNDCGAYNGFIPKPENENKRRDKNHKWRAMWKEKGIVCGLCGSSEKEFPNTGQWDLDHIIQLCDGGKDEFENTIMLCKYCHSIKNAEQARRKALTKKEETKCQTDNDSAPW